MFRGRYETTVDKKGRTSLPARFREILASEDTKLVITTALDPCLIAYPYSGWCEFEKKIAALPSFDPRVVRLKRLYVSGAMECSVDSHGRILIPSVHRQYARIAKDVVWSGMVDYIELWDAAAWKETFTRTEDDVKELGEALAQLGL